MSKSPSGSFARLFAVVTLPILLSPEPVDAATIDWGTPTTIAAASDVSTAGSFVYGYSFSDASVASITVNGVTFAAFNNGNHFGAITIGDVTLTPEFYSDGKDTGLGSTSTPFTSLPSAYRSLLDRGTSGDGYPLVLTLGGLIAGNTYAVQFWSNGSPTLFFNQASSNAKTTFTAGNSVTLDHNSTDANGGVGQWVIGTFTADGTTEDITFAPLNGNFPILNAFQLRQIPEPGCAGLLALVTAGLAGRRQRSR